MKNRYINPDTKVLIVQTQQMIAMSDQLSVGESGDAIHAEARGNDFFLFDEEAPAKSDDDDSWDGDWEDDDY